MVNVVVVVVVVVVEIKTIDSHPSLLLYMAAQYESINCRIMNMY